MNPYSLKTSTHYVGTVIDIANEYDQTFVPKAEKISQTFTKAFLLFSESHKIYDSSSLLSDEEITSLGEVHDTFVVAYYNIYFSTGVNIDTFSHYY